ncbi:perilipin-2 [Ambystoma mexicanum]|uniref:perilipin-2 n=1 Tax=Ambystoma mexicanum TaxID=8296 RepID=UPI0037E8DC89
MSSVAVEHQQNVVSRVVSLPLVSSTYGMVSSAYFNTKEHYPYLRSVCEVAEKGVMAITAVAITSAMPILQKMEPQIAVANNYACIGLDKIEEKLPILYQPSDKIVSRASDMMVGAKDVLAIKVTGAKDNVSNTITGVVGMTKEAVHDSVEMTKAVVNGSINTVLGSHVMQIVNNGVDTALTRSETLIDQYLPLTEEELAEEAANVEGFEVDQKPNYYIRLGSLSCKLRKRAYKQAISRLRDAKSRSHEAISHLHQTVALMEYAHKNINGANQKLHDAQEKLYQSWLEWSRSTSESNCENVNNAEDMESRTLAISRSLTKHLQTTCNTLVSSMHGLPHNIQEQAFHLTAMAGEVYQNFHLVSSIRGMSDNVLSTTKGQLDKMKCSLDNMVDYVVNNTPLNWLVGPFYSHMGGSPSAETEQGQVAARPEDESCRR